MAETHSPKPWIARGDFVGTDEDDPQTICYMSNHRNRHPRSKEETQANARLIAAAPELLEALKKCERLFNEALPKFDWGNSALDANAIRLLNEVPLEVATAIAKVRGKQ